MSPTTKSNAALTGRVLNIQRYCSHDGPGTRTTFSSKAVRYDASGAATRKASAPSPNLAMTPSCAKAKRNVVRV